MNDLFEFRPIPGYEGLYSVNQSNQVLSHDRTVYRGNNSYGIQKGIKLSCNENSMGYIQVNLCKNGVQTLFGIHVLVAMAWNLPKEKHHNVVKHLDNIASHNYANNLQWDTQSKNTIDAYVDGISKSGEKHYRSKITEKDVIDIRNSLLSGSELGKIYNMSKEGINKIKKGVTWKHI